MNYAEEKDSLSVRVAYIKVNISRTRRALTRTSIMTGGSNYNATNEQPFDFVTTEDTGLPNRSSFNDVKLSVIADIGTTSFVYDMRNIKEVFVFPKIWYRRSLARRVFLGEETTATSVVTEPKSELNPTAKSDSKNSFFSEQVLGATQRRRG